jgi:hypothetical protein
VLSDRSTRARGDVAAAANGPADVPGRRLREGLIVRTGARVLAFLQPFQLHRTNDADDAQPCHRRPGCCHVFRAARQVHAAADRLLIGPETPCQLFVDDDDARSLGGIGLGEEAAVLERHLQCLEVAG